MGRLTWRDENGKAWFKPLDPDCGGCEFADERCQHHVEIAAERLAAYEETGLEPEEIKTCMEELTDYRESGAGPFLCKCMKEFIDKLDGSSQERILDLLQAEKDGRLLVLPYKVGTDFYDVRQFYRRSKVANTELVKMTIDHYTIGQAGIPIATACSGENEWGDYEPHQLLTFEEAREAFQKENRSG